jgi:hypothetical protein
LKNFINSCWFVFKWGLLAALVAAAGLALYFYSRVNDEIRQRVLSIWREKYPNLVVNIRSARLVDGEGIEIVGLSLADPNATGPQAELVSFEEIMLYCQTSLPELIEAEPKFSHVRIRRPMIHATRRSDSSWSAAQLLPLPKFSERPVPIAIEGGTIEFFDPLKDPPSTLTLREINLQTQPLDSGDPAGEPSFEVRGYCAGDHFQRIEISGKFSPSSKSFDIGGSLAGLDVSPELRESLPADLSERLAKVAPLRGQAHIDFHLHENPAGPSPVLFELKGQVTRGRFEHPNLPDSLTDLAITFRADNQGITIDKLTAKTGPASVTLSGRIYGFTPGAPLSLKAHAEHLIVRGTWERILPQSFVVQWRKFLPAGEINADAALQFDGREWQPSVTVQCLNVSLTYYKYPYRLDRCLGWMTFAGNRLDMDFVGYAASQPVHVVGHFGYPLGIFNNPGEHFIGEITVSGRNIPFDRNLFDALPGKPKEVLESLNPVGTFDFEMHNHRDDPNGPIFQSLTVLLNRITVKYEKFKYQISNVRGKLVMNDHHWTFRDLDGTNGPGHITAEGWLNPLDPQLKDWELSLHFNGTNVPLQDDLCEALNPQSQRVWHQLKPQGAINLSADMHYLSAAKIPELQFSASPVEGTVSIEPEMFRYRLERLQGQLDYHEGRIDLRKIHAVHDRTVVEASGFCLFDHEGNWRLRFEPIAVDQLHADRDLLAALNGRLKRCVVALNPTGTISVNGGILEFAGNSDPNVPNRSAWNLPFEVHQGTIGNAIRFENINGGVRLIGDCDGVHARSKGLVAIDSLTFKELQFTQVQGPLWMDEKQVLLGAGAPPLRAGEQTPHVTAHFYGGMVQADCAFALGDPARYSLQAVLTDGDLKKFAHETIPGKQKLDGRVRASISLDGDTTGIHSLRGRGDAQLVKADIYELPFMVALLKLLNFKPPDASSFTNSTATYHMEGDHIYLDKLALNGDAISLEGSGEMNLDGVINLRFHSLPGRADWELPVFKTVMGAASRQVAMIRVQGTLNDPKMSREVLPGVGKALQTMQDMQLQPLYPQARGQQPQLER